MNKTQTDRERCRAAHLSELGNLPTKERKRKAATVKDYVFEIYLALKAAQGKNYSYEDLAELLCSSAKDQGLDFTITAGTLRKYMGDAAKRQVSNPHSETETTGAKAKSVPDKRVPDISVHRNRKTQAQRETHRETVSHLSPERIKNLTRPEAINHSDSSDEAQFHL